MTSCKDLLITKKIEITFYSIVESIHLGKMARTSAKSENPNLEVEYFLVYSHMMHNWETKATKDISK